jgi:hypothetical protein
MGPVNPIKPRLRNCRTTNKMDFQGLFEFSTINYSSTNKGSFIYQDSIKAAIVTQGLEIFIDDTMNLQEIYN